MNFTRTLIALSLCSGITLCDTSKRGPIFTKMYAKNKERNLESSSGPGSNLYGTRAIRDKVEDILRRHEATIVFDAGCGDFFWMKELDLGFLDLYIGADIVTDVVKETQEAYGTLNRAFIESDFICEKIPEVDIVICRDVFAHMPHADIFAALNNFKKSKSTYVLVTTYHWDHKNNDLPTGSYRPLNMQQPPFNFPEPLEFIDEENDEMNGAIGDKGLGLWHLEDIPEYEA